MPDAANQMLALLKANPTLLQLAPDNADGLHIEHRRQDEIHMCLRCGDRAHCAFIALIEIPGGIENRWLDLCEKCTHWLRTSLERQ